jgi:hypothetical protein
MARPTDSHQHHGITAQLILQWVLQQNRPGPDIGLFLARALRFSR